MIDWKKLEEDENYLCDDEKLYNEIRKLKPEDYYFQLGFESDCGTYDDYFFDITPKGYFDLVGAHSDLSGVADHVVPDKFYELAESNYEYNGNSQKGRQLLLNAGFIEKKMF